MSGTWSLGSVSTRLCQVADLARRRPEIAITTLAHHIDIAWLGEAYRRTRKDGAVGVDEIDAEAYAVDLEGNLKRLLERFKTGSYVAPPVRRVHIPKGDGTATRPIGIPTFEDKVLQRAVAMVVEAVYEQDFLDCSYGFRPGRSAHQALEHLWKQGMGMSGGWVLELDIASFFDALDHRQLREILDRRVRDGVIRRAIDKWLKAGVLEEGQTHRATTGTPQGGVISPLLANIYLHEVLDVWFERDVKPRLRGKAFLVRYADDAVMVFADGIDAERVLAVLPQRFGTYGLTLHPEKTRLVPFKRPWGTGGKGGDGSRPGTFDFLGFTHYWGATRCGGWAIKRKTAAKRLRRALRAVNVWCRINLHLKVSIQHRMLSSILRGHFAYYGIAGNSIGIGAFRQRVERVWRIWLAHRSQKARMTWQRFRRLLLRYPLPKARIANGCTPCAASP
ncbi:MAG: group II intron reverse transcriptase/maturase [Acidobacteriota bacterium]